MTQDSATLEIVDSINLSQENFFDTSSGQDANKAIGEIIQVSQRPVASEKIEKALLLYFDAEVPRIIQEHYEDNWDGYGAKGISGASVVKALEFCFNLQVPLEMSRPKIGVDGDGYVMFTWQSHKDILSIIVQPNDTLVFSSIIESERVHGILPMYPGKVHSLISEQLKQMRSRFAHGIPRFISRRKYR